VASAPPDLAERSSRLLAASIDELLLLGTALPMMIGVVPVIIGAAGKVDPLAVSSPASLAGIIDPQDVMTAMFTGPGIVISVIALLAWCVVTIWLVAKNGQSIGKKIVGIKVVRTDGSPASLSRIFLLRNLVNTLPLLLPYGWLYQLVDPLLIYQDARQCAHDKIADTIVVRCPAAVSPAS
jgi:uncharacterized RDD family membrane protein YckC